MGYIIDYYIYNNFMRLILLLHHYLFIFIFFLLLIIVLYSFKNKNQNISSLYKYINKLLVYSIHIQALFGFILLIKHYLLLMKSHISLFNIIHINSLRYKIIEHPLIMLLVVIMTTLVNIKLKRNNKINYNIILIYFLILILILSRIPIQHFL